jgi:hypothetical protein
MILLPHHHEFAETLANLPYFYQEMAKNTCEVLHVVQKSPNYLPEIVNSKDLQEYLSGGEANQFVEYVDGYDYGNEPDEPIEEANDNCLNSWELSNEWLGSI